MTDEIKSESQVAAEEGVRAIIRHAGDNPDRSGMRDTPARFVKAMLELTSGYNEDPREHLLKEFDLNDEGNEECGPTDSIIMSGAIPYVSLCEHHLLTFHGSMWIGYLPNCEDESSRVVGLSKLARMADGYAKRFQVQERLTQQIANAIQTTMKPLGAGVLLKGVHSCQCFRGVKKDGYMMTSSMTGIFREDGVRSEFFRMVEIGNR